MGASYRAPRSKIPSHSSLPAHAALRSRPVASKKYPLEPLRRLRADEVDAKARALAEAARDRAEAEVARSRRERQRDDFVARTEAEASAERGRLEKGELSVRDLSWGASWRLGVEDEKANLAELVTMAKETERQARDEEAEKLAELAQKKAEAEAVEQDHERWKRARDRRIEAKEDEAAEEAHGARLHRNREGASQ